MANPTVRDEGLALRAVELRSVYGQPMRVPDTSGVLHHLGVREQVHPRAHVAVRYSCMEEAEAYAELNRRLHGHTVYGPAEAVGGPVAVIDFSHQIGAPAVEAPDPALLDDAEAEVPRG